MGKVFHVRTMTRIRLFVWSVESNRDRDLMIYW